MRLFAILVLLLTCFLCISSVSAQQNTLSADDLIQLKEAGFSEESIQKMIVAEKLTITIDEIIKLKKADLSEETILRLRLSKKSKTLKSRPKKGC